MDIICFANDWSGDPLSKKHIMRRLAQRGSRILWVNSLGNRAPKLADTKDWLRAASKLRRFATSAIQGPHEVEQGIWVLDPIAAPAYASNWAARMNALIVGWHVRAAAKRLGFSRPIHYSFIPASAWVAGRIGEALIAYHAADEYAAFGGADARAITALEAKLLAMSELYIACSEPLLAGKSRQTRNPILVRHGVEHEHFSRALRPSTHVAPELENASHPIFGFVGLVAEWVNLEVMARLADALQIEGAGTVVVIGDERGADREQLKRLARHPRALVLGRRPYEELPRYLRAFDVALLPFIEDELTRNANPLKLREYLAAGLPVISSDLPESVALAASVHERAPKAVTIARGDDAFLAAALARGRDRDLGPSNERSAAVAGEGWDQKVRTIDEALRAAIARRATQG